MIVSDIINRALLDIAIENKNSIFFAQGIKDPTGVFGTLLGLEEVIESNRLIEMPVAENGGIGAAVGLAIQGKRPIISFHRVEFALVALEQIINNAAKAHFISGGLYTAPLLLRLIVGRGWGQGPSHSQSFESLFASVPGLKVVCPSLPSTTYDLIRNSFEDDAPTICIEHRWCHYAQSSNPDVLKRNDLMIAPKLINQGADLTIVSFGFALIECSLVIQEFAEKGISIELIDLQILRPLKLDIVFESVERTGKLIFVDQGFRTLGIGAEVVSQVVENCWESLESPPKRLGLPNLPSPSSVALAKDYFVTIIDIADVIISILDLQENTARAIKVSLKAKMTNQPDVPSNMFKGPF